MPRRRTSAATAAALTALLCQADAKRRAHPADADPCPADKCVHATKSTCISNRDGAYMKDSNYVCVTNPNPPDCPNATICRDDATDLCDTVMCPKGKCTYCRSLREPGSVCKTIDSIECEPMLAPSPKPSSTPSPKQSPKATPKPKKIKPQKAQTKPSKSVQVQRRTKSLDGATSAPTNAPTSAPSTVAPTGAPKAPTAAPSRTCAHGTYNQDTLELSRYAYWYNGEASWVDVHETETTFQQGGYLGLTDINATNPFHKGGVWADHAGHLYDSGNFHIQFDMYLGTGNTAYNLKRKARIQSRTEAEKQIEPTDSRKAKTADDSHGKGDSFGQIEEYNYDDDPTVGPTNLGQTNPPSLSPLLPSVSPSEGPKDLGADGIAFTLVDRSQPGWSHNHITSDSSTAAHMGAFDIPGFTVEFDTYHQSAHDQTAEDHVAVWCGGTNGDKRLVDDVPLPDLEDDAYHPVDIQTGREGGPNSIIVRIDGQVRINITVTPSECDLSFTAGFGWTATTGGDAHWLPSNNHRIRNVQVVQPCQVGGGAGGTGIWTWQPSIPPTAPTIPPTAPTDLPSIPPTRPTSEPTSGAPSLPPTLTPTSPTNSPSESPTSPTNSPSASPCQRATFDKDLCKPRSCVAYGDPHFVNFDGKKFDFMGPCEYLFLKDCDPCRATPFEVQIRNSEHTDDIKASMVHSVAIQLPQAGPSSPDWDKKAGKIILRRPSDGSCRTDKAPMYTTNLVGNHTMDSGSGMEPLPTLPWKDNYGNSIDEGTSNDDYYIRVKVRKMGVRLIWTRCNTIIARIGKRSVLRGQACGLCGNADCDDSNDPARIDPLANTTTYPPNSTLFEDGEKDTCTTEPDPNYTCTNTTEAEKPENCGVLNTTDYADCKAADESMWQKFYDDCLYDSCNIDVEEGKKVLKPYVDFCCTVGQPVNGSCPEWESLPPTSGPSTAPTTNPSGAPSSSPSSAAPSTSPSTSPTTGPVSEAPSNAPTSVSPSVSPTSWAPSISPVSEAPSVPPTYVGPSTSPSTSPTTAPVSEAPSTSPISVSPSTSPSTSPTTGPVSEAPSASPSSDTPTTAPSTAPSTAPTTGPVSDSPSQGPVSETPSASPQSVSPSTSPSTSPTTGPVSETPSASPKSTSPSTSPTSSPEATNPECGAVVKLYADIIPKVKVSSLETLAWFGDYRFTSIPSNFETANLYVLTNSTDVNTANKTIPGDSAEGSPAEIKITVTKNESIQHSGICDIFVVQFHCHEVTDQGHTGGLVKAMRSGQWCRRYCNAAPRFEGISANDTHCMSAWRKQLKGDPEDEVEIDLDSDAKYTAIFIYEGVADDNDWCLVPSGGATWPTCAWPEASDS